MLSAAERKANLTPSDVQCAPTSISIPIYRGIDHREKPSAVVVNRKRARDEVGRKIGNGRTLHLERAEARGLEETARLSSVTPS